MRSTRSTTLGFEAGFAPRGWSQRDDSQLGAEFVDARHHSSFDVADEAGDREWQAAHDSEIRERAEYEAEHEAGDRVVVRTASDGSWSSSKSPDGSWHGGSDRFSDGSWTDSHEGSRPPSLVQFEEGVVRGSMEGELQRLLASGTGQGAPTPQRWKSEMFVMLPESNVLKFWPQQQHGWSAQPPEAFFIELNSVSSVDLLSPLEFQIVYEGRRRLMHLRAPTAALAATWVESLRRAAALETREGEIVHQGEDYDEEPDSAYDDVRHRVDNELCMENFRVKRQQALQAEAERQEAAAWEIIEAAAAAHLRAQEEEEIELASLDQIAATVFPHEGSKLGVEANDRAIAGNQSPIAPIDDPCDHSARTHSVRQSVRQPVVASVDYDHMNRPLMRKNLSATDVAQAERAGLALKALLTKVKSDSTQKMSKGHLLSGDRSVNGRCQAEPEPEPEPVSAPSHSAPVAATVSANSTFAEPQTVSTAELSPTVLASIFDELEAASGSRGTVSSAELLSVIGNRFGTEAAVQAKRMIHGTTAAAARTSAQTGAGGRDRTGAGGMRTRSSTAAAMLAAQSALGRAAHGPLINTDHIPHLQASDTGPTAGGASVHVNETVPRRDTSGTTSAQLPLPPPSRRGPNMTVPADQAGARTATGASTLESWRQKSLSNHVDTLETAIAAGVNRAEESALGTSHGIRTNRGFYSTVGNGVPFLPSPPPLAPPSRSKPLTEPELRQVHLRQLQLGEGAAGLAPTENSVDQLHGLTLNMLSKRAVGGIGSLASQQTATVEAEAEARRQKLRSKLRAESFPLSNGQAAVDRATEVRSTQHERQQKTGGDHSFRRKAELEPESEPELEPQVSSAHREGTTATDNAREDRRTPDGTDDDSEEDRDSDNTQDDSSLEDDDAKREALEDLLRPVFEALDEDESGLLETDELRWPIGHAVERSIKHEVASHEGTEKEVQLKIKLAIDLAVSELDVDGVGAVDFDDFVGWASKNMNVVAQLAAHFNLPFVLPTQGKRVTRGQGVDDNPPPRLVLSSRVATAADAAAPAAPMSVVDAPANERQQGLPTTSCSTTMVASNGLFSAKTISSVPRGATGASIAIEERMRLMAERRIAKARGINVGTTS